MNASSWGLPMTCEATSKGSECYSVIGPAAGEGVHAHADNVHQDRRFLSSSSLDQAEGRSNEIVGLGP